ncbi:MAG: hypothetical protein Greene101420_703 [Parcubacteria group bacterium Greene1014_20]|nr:MAG: hypothetical protein Greene101420_703 [Parcubacteria group bacterium Greene1014_20]
MKVFPIPFEGRFTLDDHAAEEGPDHVEDGDSQNEKGSGDFSGAHDGEDREEKSGKKGTRFTEENRGGVKIED